MPVPGLEGDHREAEPGEPLGQYTTAGPGPDDAEVDGVLRAVLTHLEVEQPVWR